MKLYRRHIASGAFDNAADYPNGAPFDAGDSFEWVEGAPPEEAVVYQLPTLEARVKEAFSALDINLQVKYTTEIMQAAFFFERDNLPMVQAVMSAVQDRLSLPDDQPVKDIVDLASSELAG